MNQLQVFDLDLYEHLNFDRPSVIGGVAAPTFSAQVAAGAATKVVLSTNINFQNRQAQGAYAAGYSGAGSVGASINGQASATVYVYAG
jgi:hypothetical protein